MATLKAFHGHLLLDGGYHFGEPQRPDDGGAYGAEPVLAVGQSLLPSQVDADQNEVAAEQAQQLLDIPVQSSLPPRPLEPMTRSASSR